MSAKRRAMVHRCLGWLWLAISIPAILFWQHSVPFLVFVSVYANAASHFSAVEGALPDEPAG